MKKSNKLLVFFVVLICIRCQAQLFDNSKETNCTIYTSDGKVYKIKQDGFYGVNPENKTIYIDSRKKLDSSLITVIYRKYDSILQPNRFKRTFEIAAETDAPISFDSIRYSTSFITPPPSMASKWKLQLSMEPIANLDTSNIEIIDNIKFDAIVSKPQVKKFVETLRKEFTDIDIEQSKNTLKVYRDADKKILIMTIYANGTILLDTSGINEKKVLETQSILPEAKPIDTFKIDSIVIKNIRWDNGVDVYQQNRHLISLVISRYANKTWDYPTYFMMPPIVRADNRLI